MQSVIPKEVLEHLRTLAQRETSLEGKFTTRQLADEMDVGENKARKVIRELMREQKLRPQRVNLTDEQAWEIGLLGGSSVLCYEWVDQAA